MVWEENWHLHTHKKEKSPNEDEHLGGTHLSVLEFNETCIVTLLLTVFIVIIAEDWNAYMYTYVRAIGADSEGGRTIGIFYFITVFAVGNTIMLALFTALLLKSAS